MSYRLYTAQFDNVAVAAVQDFFSILMSSAKGARIHYVALGALAQTSSTELRVSLKRLPATVTQGSGGSSPTIQFNDAGVSTASVATVHANDTTQATTSGTAAILYTWTWNVLNPFEFLPTPEMQPACVVSQALVLTLNAAPGSSTNMSGTIVWQEIP